VKAVQGLNLFETNEIKKLYTLDFSGYKKDRVYTDFRTKIAVKQEIEYFLIK